MTALQKKLASLPEPLFGGRDGIDYSSLGFTADDAEALTEFVHGDDETLVGEAEQATDDARHHALRILAEVGGAASLDLLVSQFHLAVLLDDDLYCDDFPRLMERIGEVAIPRLESIVSDEIWSEDSRVYSADALGRIGNNPEFRPGIRETLVGILTDHPSARQLNAMLVDILADWRATDEMELIRGLFQRNLIDVSFCGDIEDVEIRMGLRTERETSAPNYRELEEELSFEARKDFLGEPPVDGDNLAILGYFLALYGTDESIAVSPELEGFLVGLLIGPDLTLPSSYIPFIWDFEDGHPDASPLWRSQEEAQMFYTALMSAYNDVLHDLQDDRLGPVVHYQGSDEGEMASLSPWVSGVLIGCRLWNDCDLRAEELQAALVEACLEIIARETDGEELINHDDPDEGVLHVLIMIHEIFSAHVGQSRLPHSGTLPSGLLDSIEPVRREHPKIGRNDPCPCGSGKKFKNCCLN